MKLLLRLFAAFCVATVLAQAIIIGLSAFRGSVTQETVIKIVALLNGIDITGQRLQKMLEDSRKIPVPTYDDVVNQRAHEDLNLDMRERSVKLALAQLEAKQAELKVEIANFDNRKEAFYAKLDDEAKGMDTESLKAVQRTLEALPAEQSKDLLLKMIADNQLQDVVAIVKGMPLDKQKKILGEFVEPAESEKLYEIVRGVRKGEAKAELIDKARNQPAS
jgi:hypothetical protein